MFNVSSDECAVPQDLKIANNKLLTSTRQCAQGHRTYEIGITKCEVRFSTNLEVLDLLVSDEWRKDIFGMKYVTWCLKVKPFSLHTLMSSLSNIKFPRYGQNKFLICIWCYLWSWSHIVFRLKPFIFYVLRSTCAKY